RRLARGDLFHLDAYGAVDGYLFDFGRSCVVGGVVDDGQRALLEGGIEAVERGIETAGPGVRVKDIYFAVHDSLVAQGLAPEGDVEDPSESSALAVGFPVHGHSLGLGWEAPWIVPTEERELEPGMCI